MDFWQQNYCQLYHSRWNKNCDVRIAKAVMEEDGVVNFIVNDQYPVLSNYMDVCCEDEELRNNCGCQRSSICLDPELSVYDWDEAVMAWSDS